MMSDDRARRILRNFLIFGAWGSLVLTLNLAMGWFWFGMAVLAVVIVVHDTRRFYRQINPKKSKRVGPPMEWIN